MMDPVEELARTQEDIYNTEKEIERVKEEGKRLIAELESRLTILQLREVSLLEKAQQPVARPWSWTGGRARLQWMVD